MRSSVAFVVVAIACVACTREPLRGDAERSADGKTYLAVMDRNGCANVKVDGRDWPWEEGIAKPIDPGTHRISCGEDSGIEFTIRVGEKFNFDYWGP